MSYDIKCHALAKAFLADHNADGADEMVGDLSQHIQDAIDEFIEERGDELRRIKQENSQFGAGA